MRLRAEAAAPNQPALPLSMRHRDRGNGFALNPEVTAMWYLPLSITLEMKRTRTSWQLRFRVRFIL